MRIIKQDLEIRIYNYDKDWYITWIKNRKRHREDGPTQTWSDGDEYYYLNGIDYFKDEDYYWKKVHANY